MLTRIFPKFSRLSQLPHLPKFVGMGLLGSLTLLGVLSIALPGRSGVQQPLNIIANLQGDVQILRQTWLGPFARFQPAQIGTNLSPSDRLQVPSNGRVRVICNNLNIWNVPSDRISVVAEGCPNQGNQKLFREGRTTVSPRGPVKPDVLYLISPSHTTLLESHPTFRWNPLPGATRYQVEIRGSQDFRWETTVTEPQVTYTGTTPLVDSGYYFIKIWVAGQPCENFSGSRCQVGFEVLSPAEGTIVREEIQLLQTQLSGVAAPITIAYRYEALELKQAALETLEKAVAENPSSAPLHHQLAVFYHKAGLFPLAENTYRKALDLTPITFLDDRANLQEGLGQIAQVRGQNDDAVQWFTQAKNSYEQLGDTKNQQRLQSQIRLLKR